MPATYNLSDAFISYSRRDSIFVRRLDEALKKHNREVWVDWEDIPLTADWWEEIKAGIEGANTFIFIITPDSVQSEICYDEIQHAISNNKRMIPVLHRDILDDEMKAKMHPTVSTHNWVFFRAEDNFDEAIARVLSALESDLNHVRMHTRFLVRAREWDARERDHSFLLSGGEVHEAENWITTAGSKEPRPSELHTDYILASRSAENQRQRRIMLGISTALVVALALGVLSFILFQASQRNLTIAENNAATATIAQGQAQIEANRASTQAAAAQTAAAAEANARATSDVNEQIAHTQAALAAIAQERAVSEADRAVTQAAIAQNNAATATIAQGLAQIEANNAATQAAIAEQNAATATIAQGQAQIEANRASTQAAAAQTAAAAEANARATSDINESVAQIQAAIAEGAQIEAVREANRAVTQAAIAEQNAATATIAQGQAQIEANNAATQAAIAEQNAAAATIAQGQSVIEANRASTQAAIAEYNAATATVAQGQAQIREQEARAQALTVRAEQALNFGDTDIALALALESAKLNPNLLQTQSVLNRIAAYSPVLIVDDVQRGIFSLDNSSLLTLNRDQNTLALWNIAQRQKRYAISGHDDIINDFVFSRDGRQIVTVSQDGRVGMWNADDGSLIRYLDDHGTPVNRVLMHPDGKRFITAGTNGVIFLRNLDDGEKIGEFRTTTPDTFDQIYFNADGRALYAWSANPPIVMSRWDVERQLLLPRQSQRFVYFARNGLFRIADDGAGLLLHSTDGDGIILRLPNNVTEILDFTPDGRGILVRTSDESLALLDRATGDAIRIFSASGVSEASIGQLVFTNRNTIASSANDAIIAPDGSTVLSILNDSRVVMWDIRDGRQIRQIGVSDLELSNSGMTRDSRYALTIAEDGTARVLDMTGLQSTAITNSQERRDLVQQIINARRESGGLYGEFYTINWNGVTSPDGRQWLFNYDGFNLALRDLQSGDTAVLENTLNNNSSSIRQFSPDSRYLITGFRSGPIRVWDVQANDWKWNTLEMQGATNLEEILFTPNVDELVAFYDRMAIRWNLVTGEASQHYATDNTVTVLSRQGAEEDSKFYSWFFSEPQNQISRDGQQITRIMLDTSSSTALLLMWDTPTGQLLRDTNLLDDTASNQRFGARFNPDGSAYIRVGLVDNSIEMFSTRTGEQTRRFFGHSDVVNGVGFSPDGQRLVSSAQNHELLLWDVTTGQLVRPLETGNTIQQQSSTSTNILFVPGGEAAAYPNGTALTLDMPVIRIETLADVVNWVQSNRQLPVLTCAEREQYSVLPLCEEAGETIATPTTVVTPSPIPTPTPTTLPTETLVPSPTPFPVGAIQSSTNVNLRSGPSQEFRVTGAVTPGTIVEIIEQSGDWLKVRLRDNSEGWLIADVVRR